MVHVHRFLLIPQYCLCSIPVLLSVAAVQDASLWLGLTAIVALFVLLWCIPFCKGRESLFSFLMVTLMGLPMNVRIVIFLWEHEIIGDPFWVSGVLWSVVLFGMLFSVEQIIVGIVAKAIQNPCFTNLCRIK